MLLVGLILLFFIAAPIASAFHREAHPEPILDQELEEPLDLEIPVYYESVDDPSSPMAQVQFGVRIGEPLETENVTTRVESPFNFFAHHCNLSRSMRRLVNFRKSSRVSSATFQNGDVISSVLSTDTAILLQVLNFLPFWERDCIFMHLVKQGPSKVFAALMTQSSILNRPEYISAIIQQRDLFQLRLALIFGATKLRRSLCHAVVGAQWLPAMILVEPWLLRHWQLNPGDGWDRAVASLPRIETANPGSVGCFTSQRIERWRRYTHLRWEFGARITHSPIFSYRQSHFYSSNIIMRALYLVCLSNNQAALDHMLQYVRFNCILGMQVFLHVIYPLNAMDLMSHLMERRLIPISRTLLLHLVSDLRRIAMAQLYIWWTRQMELHVMSHGDHLKVTPLSADPMSHLDQDVDRLMSHTSLISDQEMQEMGFTSRTLVAEVLKLLLNRSEWDKVFNFAVATAFMTFEGISNALSGELSINACFIRAQMRFQELPQVERNGMLKNWENILVDHIAPMMTSQFEGFAAFHDRKLFDVLKVLCERVFDSAYLSAVVDLKFNLWHLQSEDLQALWMQSPLAFARRPQALLQHNYLCLMMAMQAIMRLEELIQEHSRRPSIPNSERGSPIPTEWAESLRVFKSMVDAVKVDVRQDLEIILSNCVYCRCWLAATFLDQGRMGRLLIWRLINLNLSKQQYAEGSFLDIRYPSRVKLMALVIAHSTRLWPRPFAHSIASWARTQLDLIDRNPDLVDSTDRFFKHHLQAIASADNAPAYR